MTGDFSPDLDLGILAPSPSVRGAEGNAPNTNSDNNAPRRRARPMEESEAEAGEPDTAGEHQLDRIA